MSQLIHSEFINEIYYLLQQWNKKLCLRTEKCPLQSLFILHPLPFVSRHETRQNFPTSEQKWKFLGDLRTIILAEQASEFVSSTEFPSYFLTNHVNIKTSPLTVIFCLHASGFTFPAIWNLGLHEIWFVKT